MQASDIKNESRDALQYAFNQLFAPLVEFVRKLPINDLAKMHCCQNLDQGLFWAVQGISSISNPPPATPEAATSEAALVIAEPSANAAA